MIKVLKFKLNDEKSESNEDLILEVNDSITVAKLGYAVLAALEISNKKDFELTIKNNSYWIKWHQMNDSDATIVKLRDFKLRKGAIINLFYDERINFEVKYIGFEKVPDARIFIFPQVADKENVICSNGLKYNFNFHLLYWDLRFGYECSKKED